MLRAAAVSVAVLLAAAVPHARADASLNATINSWIARSAFAGTHTSLLVYDKNANRFLGVHDATTMQKPASNMKLLTSAATLERYGIGTHFTTQVMTGGSLNGSTLHGNLWLVGGGDPSLSTGTFSKKVWGGASGRLDQLAQAVKAAGITSVTGDIIGDESRFDTRRTAPFWKPSYWRDSPPITALSVNMDLYSFGEPQAAPSPAEHSAALFRLALIGAGVKVAGGASQATRPSTVHVVASEQSPPTSRLVHQMDQQSVNFYAEVLTKNLAIRGGRAGTTANGVRTIRNAIHDLGLSYKTARIYDGSGLSTGDRLSAAQILGLLRNVGQQGWSSYYRAALPLAGVSGTLEDRMKAGPGPRQRDGKDRHAGRRLGALGLPERGQRPPHHLLDDHEPRGHERPGRPQAAGSHRAAPGGL